MFLFSILILIGFVMLGRAARSTEKHPILILGGFALVGLALFGHFTAGQPLVATIGRSFAEVGVGLLIMAGMAGGSNGRALLGVGSLSMIAGVAILASRSLLGMGTTTLLLELGPDDSIAEVSTILAHHGAEWNRSFPTVDLSEDVDLAQVYTVRVSAFKAAALTAALLKDAENVDHVELEMELTLDLPSTESLDEEGGTSVLENDPLVNRQWALDAIRGHEAHAFVKDLTPVRKAIVAIVDTGVDGSHEDIAGVYGDSPASVDRHGHGSHCAGIAGAATNNSLGIASLNWEGRFLDIRGYSALDASGMGTIETTADGIIAAAEDHADVISLSLGSNALTIPKTLRDAVAFARRRGSIVIAAAGNSNEDASRHVPSNIDGVISVGAVDQRLAKATFSNRNASLTRPIAAPGVDILSLKTTGGYVQMSGTSMATPMVAGLAGMMRALNPELSDDGVYKILHDSGRDVPATSSTGRLIDAAAALRAAVGDA